jgi:hypothetical protein
MTKFNPNTTKQAPASAFAFAASECKFADPTERVGKLQRMPVNVLARTGKPVFHWYWDWIVHDLDGMSHKPTIAFDYRHDPDEPIGVANTFEVKNGNLYLSGELISRDPEDEAAKIMDLGPAGVPYEQSIHFDPRSVQLEYLPEGTQTIVNGEQVNGPLTIVRKWELLRCAFCLTGVDGGTQTFFESKGQADAAALFDLNWKGSQMTKTTEASKPGEQGSSDVGKEANAGKQAETAAVVNIDLAAERSKFEAELKSGLKRFTDKFGMEDGASYFTESLTYEAALEKHNAKLEAAVKTAQTATKTAEEKLAKLDLGEQSGIDTGANTDKKATWESLFKPA